MDTHALERISPKGSAFIGSCVKCGKTGLGPKAVFEECPNPEGRTQADDIINAIDGPPAAPERK